MTTKNIKPEKYLDYYQPKKMQGKLQSEKQNHQQQQTPSKSQQKPISNEEKVTILIKETSMDAVIAREFLESNGWNLNEGEFILNDTFLMTSSYKTVFKKIEMLDFLLKK